MIGVAFALEALVTGDGLIGAAFSELAAEYAAERGLELDPAKLERAAAHLDALAGRHRELPRDATAAALDGVLALSLEAAVAEARLRMIAASLVPALVHPFPQTASTLGTIASLAMPCAVVARGWTHVAHRAAASAGFRGPVLVAEDLGVPPESLAAFAALARTLALPAERIWFVGCDEARHIAPARAAGFHTIRVDRTPGAVASGDVVTRLDEILPLLGGPYTRSALQMRDVMRTALAWRPGHYLPGGPPDERARS